MSTAGLESPYPQVSQGKFWDETKLLGGESNESNVTYVKR